MISTTSAAVVEAPAGAPKLRITRRGRAVLTTLAALPVVAGALVVALNGGMALATGDGSPSTASTFTYVTVNSGQSMWELAEKLAPESDPRDVVAEIVALNQLDSAGVSPGQQLAVPRLYTTSDS